MNSDIIPSLKLEMKSITCSEEMKKGRYNLSSKNYGIKCYVFNPFIPVVSGMHNNRDHRKITVIDGVVGFTGGINIADEYINEVERFGHWKDVGIRLEGEAVRELTKLFLIDFGINLKTSLNLPENLYPTCNIKDNGYVIPFGDGPKPLYERRVGKTIIQNILATATKYVYITTPYLIIDNSMKTLLMMAAKSGIDVRIVTPHIPDKWYVHHVTQYNYLELLEAGVRIYEYTPGLCLGDKTVIALGSCSQISQSRQFTLHDPGA